MRLTIICAMAPLAVLSACGAPSQPTQSSPADTDRVSAGKAPEAQDVLPAAPPATEIAGTANSVPPKKLSCAADIGAAAAAKRVEACRNVSPATHPPCNAANSCAMIEEEIARSCALFDGKGKPMAGCEPAPKSKEAAAAVVQRYYSAINAHDYGTAWSQWGDDGRPGQTMAKFAAGFANTRSTHVAIGKLEASEGGAGSIYQTVPVTIESTLNDGTHQRFRGNYVIRRVNDVDGTTASQRRWHIDSAKLKSVPAN